MSGYEDLEVYRRGMECLRPLHDLVKQFPDFEKFDLANQMRRASKSIPTNIAEGYARRRSPKEFVHFLAIAMGSSNEMEVHFKVAKELEYVSEAQFNEFVERYQIIGKQLNKLVFYWSHSNRDNGTGAAELNDAVANQRPGD